MPEARQYSNDIPRRPWRLLGVPAAFNQVSRSSIVAGVVLLVIGTAWGLAPLSAQDRPRINREVAGIRLGATSAEVAKVLTMKEREDPLVTLLRKYISASDAEKKLQANQSLGKQLFTLKGRLPDGVDEMDANFLKGTVYQIRLHYGEKYVRTTAWDVFTLESLRRYGAASVTNGPELALSTVTYEWNDGKTRLQLRKSGKLSGDGNSFDANRYDVFYIDITMSQALHEEEAKETDRGKRRPQF